MERPLVTAITHSTGESKITLLGVPDRPGIAARIFGALADANVNVDMIIQNEAASAGAGADMSFTVTRDDMRVARLLTLEPVVDELGIGGIKEDEKMGKVSVVGAGICAVTRALRRRFSTCSVRPGSTSR